MRDFDLLRATRRGSEVHEQTRVSTIYSRTEDRDFARADQAGVTVSEVCRRHGLSPSVLYRWRAVAQGGSAVALKRDVQRATRKESLRNIAEIIGQVQQAHLVLDDALI